MVYVYHEGYLQITHSKNDIRMGENWGFRYMLYMTMFTWEPGKTEEVMKMRTKETQVPGRKILKEWIALETNLVFRLVEITDPAALLKSSSVWSDLGYIEIHPVMEAEEALKLLK
jgi:hypothetical protein